MNEQTGIIPSEDDFQEISVKILQLISQSDHPPSKAEISEFTNRTTDVIQVYTERLLDVGIIDFIPTGGGKWGFTHKTLPKR